MKIGLTCWATGIDDVLAQATEADRAGFSSLWFASGVLGDPMVAMSIAGRETKRIELGTAMQQIPGRYSSGDLSRAPIQSRILAASGVRRWGRTRTHRSHRRGRQGRRCSGRRWCWVRGTCHPRCRSRRC